MKKIILASLLAISTQGAFAQQDYAVEIKGKFSNLKEGDQLVVFGRILTKHFYKLERKVPILKKMFTIQDDYSLDCMAVGRSNFAGSVLDTSVDAGDYTIYAVNQRLAGKQIEVSVLFENEEKEGGSITCRRANYNGKEPITLKEISQTLEEDVTFIRKQ